MTQDVELTEIRDFLAGTAPFDELPDRLLDQLPRRLTIRYVRRGRALIARGSDNHHLFVVRSGAIEIRDADDNLVERGAEGTCVGSITLVEGNPSTFEVTAIEDTLVLAMDAATFTETTAADEGFRTFFDRQRAARMRGAVAALHVTASGDAILRSSVRDHLGRPPVAIEVGASTRDAARVMDDARVSCVLVLDAGRLAGIVTDRDLRRVLATGRDVDAPVTEVMTADPVTAPVESMAFELLLTMASRAIHHLPVVEAGRPVGVVTTTDLVRLQQANPVYLAGDVAKQTTVEGIADIAARLPEVVEVLVRQDASADDIGRIVTAVGDSVERRVLDLAEERLGPPPVPYCWVTLGSRARLEQALAADQDHAMILSDEADETHGVYFGALAAFAVDALERCGYPRCPGEVMATNARWRLPLAAWRRAFARWLDEPTPDAVLAASIFFDMRPVHGDTSLFAALDGGVRARVPEAGRFLGHLSREAVDHAPPLGFFRNLVVEREGEHARALDIKKGGVAAVVKLARVHALRAGAPALNTQARIAAAVAAGSMSAEQGEDLRDAFEFISYVRLRHQAAQVRTGGRPDSFVDPSDLSGFDRRHLREAFAIIRHAQSTLGASLPGGFVP
jgi:CBS domain-containing protein